MVLSGIAPRFSSEITQGVPSGMHPGVSLEISFGIPPSSISFWISSVVHFGIPSGTPLKIPAGIPGFLQDFSKNFMQDSSKSSRVFFFRNLRNSKIYQGKPSRYPPKSSSDIPLRISSGISPGTLSEETGIAWRTPSGFPIGTLSAFLPRTYFRISPGSSSEVLPRTHSGNAPEIIFWFLRKLLPRSLCELLPGILQKHHPIVFSRTSSEMAPAISSTIPLESSSGISFQLFLALIHAFQIRLRTPSGILYQDLSRNSFRDSSRYFIWDFFVNFIWNNSMDSFW